MSPCSKCNSKRMVGITAKASDTFSIESYNTVGLHQGYNDVGLLNLDGMGEDYIDFEYCLDCGTIAGEFPAPDPKLDV